MWTETWNYTDINGQEGNSFFSFWFFKLSNIERSTMRTFSGFQVFPGISSPLKYVTRWLDYECLSRLFSLLVFAQQKRRIILWWCVYCVKFWCRSTSPRSELRSFRPLVISPLVISPPTQSRFAPNSKSTQSHFAPTQSRLKVIYIIYKQTRSHFWPQLKVI